MLHITSGSSSSSHDSVRSRICYLVSSESRDSRKRDSPTPSTRLTRTACSCTEQLRHAYLWGFPRFRTACFAPLLAFTASTSSHACAGNSSGTGLCTRSTGVFPSMREHEVLVSLSNHDQTARTVHLFRPWSNSSPQTC
jgi:hypothetical protein